MTNFDLLVTQTAYSLAGAESTGAFSPASISATLALALSLWAMAARSDQRSLALNAAASLFWATNGMLIGAMTSGAVQIIIGVVCVSRLVVFRQPMSRQYNKAPLTTALDYAIKESHWKYVVMPSSLVVFALAVAATWQGIYSVPAAGASLCLLLSIGFGKGIWLRLGFLLANTLFLWHSIMFDVPQQTMACLVCYLAIGWGIAQNLIQKLKDHRSVLPKRVSNRDGSPVNFLKT